MRRNGRWLAMVALLLAGTVLAADPYGIGDAVRPLRFETQFGDEVVIDASTKLLLVTHDMDAGNVAKAVLADHTAATLAARGAVYVADIAKMPGFVSRFMAIPRMRRRPYPVLLDREGETLRLFPSAPGTVSAIWLDGGEVTRLAQLGTEAEVRDALGPVAP